jgi:hypothetical protein
MAKQSTGESLLVLSDRLGNMYAIPLEVLERHKLPDEEKVRYADLFESDVAGYAMSLGDQEAGQVDQAIPEVAMLFDSPKRDWMKQNTSDIFPLLLGIIVTTHPELKEKPLGAWPV